MHSKQTGTHTVNTEGNREKNPHQYRCSIWWWHLHFATEKLFYKVTQAPRQLNYTNDFVPDIKRGMKGWELSKGMQQSKVWYTFGSDWFQHKKPRNYFYQNKWKRSCYSNNKGLDYHPICCDRCKEKSQCKSDGLIEKSLARSNPNYLYQMF